MISSVKKRLINTSQKVINYSSKRRMPWFSLSNAIPIYRNTFSYQYSADWVRQFQYRIKWLTYFFDIWSGILVSCFRSKECMTVLSIFFIFNTYLSSPIQNSWNHLCNMTSLWISLPMHIDFGCSLGDNVSTLQFMRENPFFFSSS